MKYSGDFKKLIYSHLYDRIKDTAGALKEGKNLPKGNHIKNIGKRATTLKSFTGISNVIKDQAKKKKDKRDKQIKDLKISGNSKKTKSKSNKGTNYSGPGDATL